MTKEPETPTTREDLSKHYSKAADRLKSISLYYNKLLRWAESFEKNLSLPSSAITDGEGSLQCEAWRKKVRQQISKLTNELLEPHLCEVENLLHKEFSLLMMSNEPKVTTAAMDGILDNNDVEGLSKTHQEISLKSHSEVKEQLAAVRIMYDMKMVERILNVYGAKQLNTLEKRYYTACYYLAQYVLLSQLPVEELELYLIKTRPPKIEEPIAPPTMTTDAILDHLRANKFVVTQGQLDLLISAVKANCIPIKEFPGYGGSGFSINAVDSWNRFLGCLLNDHPIKQALAAYEAKHNE